MMKNVLKVTRKCKISCTSSEKFKALKIPDIYNKDSEVECFEIAPNNHMVVEGQLNLDFNMDSKTVSAWLDLRISYRYKGIIYSCIDDRMKLYKGELDMSPEEVLSYSSYLADNVSISPCNRGLWVEVASSYKQLFINPTIYDEGIVDEKCFDNLVSAGQSSCSKPLIITAENLMYNAEIDSGRIENIFAIIDMDDSRNFRVFANMVEEGSILIEASKITDDFAISQVVYEDGAEVYLGLHVNSIYIDRNWDFANTKEITISRVSMTPFNRSTYEEAEDDIIVKFLI